MARPTHIGNTTFGFGLVTVGVGDDPDAPTGDAPTPDDVAPSVGVLFPVLVGTGNPAFVQSKYGTAVTGGVTLDTTPTAGNILVFFAALREAAGVTVTPSGTGWTLVESANTGSSGNWPCFVYWRPVSLGDGTTWTATRSDAAADIDLFITEFSGVAGVDVSDESSDLTTEPTLSLTPVTSEPIILYSGVSLRRDVITDFTPATGMTELHNVTSGGISGLGPQMAVNYRIVDAPTGSYTVGSTWGGGNNRAVIGAAFVGSAGGTIYINGPLITDGSDSTFEYVAAGAQGDASLEVVLGVAMRFASFRLVIGHDSAGSVEYALMGANAANFSDEVELVSVTFTATGSFTADTVTASWSQSTGYKYYRLVPTTPDDIRIYTFSLYEPPDPGEAIDDHLTDAVDAHDASAISIVDAGAYFAATDVEAALQELGAGGSSISYGSNASHVAEISLVGVATAVARTDHYHAGIAQVTASSSNTLQRGTVNFRSGNNISFGLTDGDGDGEFDTITINGAAGGAGGALDWGEDADISTLDYDDVADAGVLDEAARADHVHGMPSAGGGGGTDPTIPSGGTLYDGSATTGWTSFGSPDTFNADSTVADHFYLAKATMGSNNLVGAYRAVGGSFPRTYTLKVGDATFHRQYQGANILIGEAAPGKYWTFGIVWDSNYYPQRYAWNSDSSSGASVNYTNPGAQFVRTPAWLRIVVNSSTDVELWHSHNGLVYTRLAAAQNPGFTIGVFGFGMYTFAGIEMRAAYDWIHES